MKKRKKPAVQYWFLECLAVILALIILFPIFWMAFVSLKPENHVFKTIFDYFFPPYTLSNYSTVIAKSKVARWFLNSIVTSTVITAAGVLIGAMAAYPIAKMQFKSKKIVYIYLLIGLMVPVEATIVGLFSLVNDLSMINTFSGLILPAITNSMNVIIMITFFTSIPDELIEAAMIDGAGELYIFTKIIIPMGKTVMVSVAIFTFNRSWNSFLWPYLCAMKESMFTLTVGVPSFIDSFNETVVMPMTVSMIASAPLLVLFMFFQKYIVKGISMNGIKG